LSDQDKAVCPPRKILLATDLSPGSDRALDRAAQLARHWGVQLVIVHALPRTIPSSGYDLLDLPSWRRPPDRWHAIEQQIRRDLREEVASLSIRVEEGDPGPVILDVLAQEGCDLLVMGMTKNELFGPMLAGNTVEQLVRTSPVSVLVVKQRPNGNYQHVLVGTDFTDESEYGLVVATRLFPHASFMLMHAFEMPYRRLVSDNKLSQDFAAMERETIRSFLEHAAITEELRQHIRTTIEHGPPEVMLPRYVQERGADLTVIGTYGRGLMFHVLVGGNARRIVDAVPSDILVVRAKRAAGD
jgi:nucleotide-binding universal stress UspA family protein